MKNFLLIRLIQFFSYCRYKTYLSFVRLYIDKNTRIIMSDQYKWMLQITRFMWLFKIYYYRKQNYRTCFQLSHTLRINHHPYVCAASVIYFIIEELRERGFKQNNKLSVANSLLFTLAEHWKFVSIYVRMDKKDKEGLVSKCEICINITWLFSLYVFFYYYYSSPKEKEFNWKSFILLTTSYCYLIGLS